ncbi:NUDIX hydrolase [Candidatus Saccharibacteria bacterium]|nr:NUDIX hydrolase [Candidatus Saccharibacteria bacterium]
MRDIPTNAVKAVIRNKNDEILFVRRHKKRDGVTNWDLPGGLVEPGEDKTVALNREVSEELGINADIGGHIGTWSFFRPLDGKTVEVENFNATLSSDRLVLSDEHDEAKWFPEKDLSSLALKDLSILDALSHSP